MRFLLAHSANSNMRNGIKTLKHTTHPFTILKPCRISGALPVILSVALAVSAENSIAQEIVLPPGNPPIPNARAKYHMGPLGKPCLTMHGYAKPELINKNLYQHWISAANNCGQTIKVQVCYYQTEDCTLMSVPPWERKDTILGIFPALKRFQFEAKEQF
jgi:hypothetical protein